MIKAFKGTSLVDYPNEIAFVIFTGGCNLRCPFCYNKSLVDRSIYTKIPEIPFEKILSELKRRENFLGACVITGGEPTIHGEKLLDLLKLIRETKLKIKLDTNGMKPDVVEFCLKNKLLDYIALDIKTSPNRYEELGGSWEKLKKTLEVIKKSGIPYEIRITATPGFVDEKTIEQIGKEIAPVKRIAVQKFIGKNTLDPRFEGVAPYPPEKMKKLGEIASAFCDEIILR